MQKLTYPCICGGALNLKKERVIQEGIDCGILDIEYCSKCGDIYLPEESMLIVEQKLKDAGLWAVERKEVKFWRSGKSVVIRLPTELVKGLKMTARKGFIYREGEHKLVIEY